jgi:hypothetical protein
MASESSITEHCLLCGRELPRGGFSARVAGVLLSPLCVECHRRCTTDPDSVVAEHPPLFDRSEVTERPYPNYPTFKGVWSTVANFALLLLPDTRCGQYPQPHK